MSRVAITTDRFEKVAVHFEALGLTPVEAPCVRIEAAGIETLDRARRMVAAADVVILGSARTVEILWPGVAMPDVEVAAVGAATAGAAEAAGARVAVVGDGGLDRLVERAGSLLRRGTVAFPHGAGSDPRGMDLLRTASARLYDEEVYASVPVAPPQVDVGSVAFGSPSAVEGWTSARSLDDLVVAVIGETTARAVSRHRAPDVIAPRTSYPALAEALAAHLQVTA